MAEQILRIEDVKALTGLARSTIYGLVAEERFPKPIRLTTRCVGWLRSELEEWIAARVSTSRRLERTGTNQ